MIGKTLGHYRIVEQLGAGGMGVVYRARDERLERDVAVKVLPAGSLGDESARSRFRREALALARLTHPNIAHVYDFDSQGGTDFLAMEFVPGQTLAHRLQAGALPEKEVLTLGGQVASALEEAHEHDIIHRDLKPANVILTPKGQAKVLDFGLAKLLRPGAGGDATQTLTEPHSVAGTLPYMAPEQLRGEAADARVDIYALGCVLYEMATGRRPFSQPQPALLLHDILNSSPQPLRALNPALTPELERVVSKCIEKDPENRYQSAKELVVDLRRAATPSAVLRTAATEPAKRRQGGLPRMTWGVILGGALLILAVLAVWLRPWVPKTRPPAAASIPERPVLAVLPLRVLGGQSSDAELGLGLSDAIITALGSSPGLTVRPTGMVLGYQGKPADPVQAGKDLRADVVLDGTLQKAGSALRLNVQLWQVSSGTTLWSQKYDAQFRDIFSLQDEIGARVADTLRVEIATAARSRLRAEYSKDPVIYTSLLHGRSLLLHRSRENLLAAISLFREVLATEPENALALAWLSDSCRLMNFLYEPRNSQYVDCGEANARRALEIDPNLAEAYAAQAGIFWIPQRGFQHERAHELYVKALHLNPNLAQEHAYLGVILYHVGLYDRAVAETHRALEIEPDNLRALSSSSDLDRLSGEVSQAEETARAALRSDPDYLFAKDALLEALFAQNKLDDVETLLKQYYFGMTGFRIPYYQGMLAARRGRFAEAERLSVQAAEGARGFGTFHHVAFGAAQTFAMSGKPAEAVRWMREAARDGMPGYPIFHDDPILKKLAGDPDYEKFLGEIRLQWERRKREW